MNRTKKSCLTCEHAVWCDSWTEYKCLVKIRRIYEPEKEAWTCDDCKKDTRKEQQKCQCKHCLSRAGEDD